MSRVSENKAREHRIEMETVVDAYNAAERAMGWYCYLEERLKVPFKARCKSKRTVSPLRIREEVNVLGMAPEKECESEMFVRVRWSGRNLAVPLSQLEPLAADRGTKEAVADWYYWLDRGYEF
jgi:Calcium binding